MWLTWTLERRGMMDKCYGAMVIGVDVDMVHGWCPKSCLCYRKKVVVGVGVSVVECHMHITSLELGTMSKYNFLGDSSFI